MRFDQVKMVAGDVEALAGFYEVAIGCRMMAPITDFTDEVLSRGMGAPGAHVRMAWLAFPGASDGSPLLELYQLVGWHDDWPYRPGQGHVAFEVDDVPSAVDRVVTAGGSLLGEIVDWKAPSGNQARFVFLRDPEGNVVDLWGRP